MNMANILIVNGSYFLDSPGGTSRLAFDLTHELVKRGHKVWYLCQDISNKDMEKENIGSLTILRYSTGRYGVNTHLKHVHEAEALLAKHIKEPIDIVHGHEPLQYIAAINTIEARGNRWVYTIHSPAQMEMEIVWREQGFIGSLKRRFGMRIIKEIEVACLKNTDQLTCKSLYTAREIERLYGHSYYDRIKMIHGWVDEKRFFPRGDKYQLRSELGWVLDGPIFFCLRRMVPRVGLDNLIVACKQLVKEGIRFKLYIGGTGYLIDQYKSMVNNLGLENHIFFLGRVSEEDLPKMYSACDASIVPTKELECFGLIAIESLACGTPVLSTPVGALPEIVLNYSASWISKGFEPTDIACLILDFIHGNVEILDRIEISERTKQLYSMDKAINEYLKAYGIDNA
jgi:glycosyltransferase involved in cell wall biosynthesis